MKKVLHIITAFVLFASQVQAQKVLIDKISLPATGREFGIYIDINVSEGAKVFYDLQTADPQQQAQAELSSMQLGMFIPALQKARDVFVKWSNISREKGIRQLVKPLSTTFADQTIYFTKDNKWNHENGVDMKALFYVDADGGCQLIFQSDYMTSEEVIGESSGYIGGFLGMSTNSKYSISHFCGGSSLSFTSKEEIDEFIDKLNAALEKKINIISDGKLLK